MLRELTVMFDDEASNDSQSRGFLTIWIEM